MPLYDYRCADGHVYERLVPLDDGGVQACPACGGGSAKIPSRVALGGVADTGRSMDMMPQTWRGTSDGSREHLGQLRSEWGKRQKLEEKHPELQGDRRPILAHEGRYENAPLRLGDPLPKAGGHTHSHGAGGHSHASPSTSKPAAADKTG